MNRRAGWAIVTAVAAVLVAAGCQQPTAVAAAPAIHIEERDSGLDQLTLEPRAAERLGVTTAAVEERDGQLAAPYASVIYAADGTSWVYVQGKGLTFERAPVTIEAVDGDVALLSDGPAAGSQVVTTGAAELYGAETGVGGGH